MEMEIEMKMEMEMREKMGIVWCLSGKGPMAGIYPAVDTAVAVSRGKWCDLAPRRASYVSLILCLITVLVHTNECK